MFKSKSFPESAGHCIFPVSFSEAYAEGLFLVVY